MRTADAVILDGDVLQHPTTPVVNETNMKKKATMKSAIIARAMSAKQIGKVSSNMHFFLIPPVRYKLSSHVKCVLDKTKVTSGTHHNACASYRK